MKTISRLLPLALATGLLLSAVSCKPRAGATAPAAPAMSAPALPIVRAAPAWSIKDLDGRDITAASLKGKVVVVDFWATWCGPCVTEIPGYVALQKKYGPEGLVIIGVSEDQGAKGPDLVRKFARQHGINYTLAMDDGQISEAFGGFDAIPTTFLIDRAGNIRHSKVGALPHEEYEKLVVSLLK
ncbi:MAG: TlpA family protein disulfide reductase [Opitutae bacterium]|nr:TlpA family protein disulfide reductase [Opitutae bacterium]